MRRNGTGPRTSSTKGEPVRDYVKCEPSGQSVELFEHIRDDTYQTKIVAAYNDPDTFYSTLRWRVDCYCKNPMANQAVTVRVHCEGAGKVAQFYRVAAKYCIPVYSPAGFGSHTFKWATVQRIRREWEENLRPTVVIHAGDLDPSGVNLFEVFAEEVLAYLSADVPDENPEDLVEFRRIMLQPEQVPPHGKTPFDLSKHKDKDYRAKSWSLDYTAELECFLLEECLRVLREEIEDILDLEQIKQDQEAEREERRLVETLASLGHGAAQ